MQIESAQATAEERKLHVGRGRIGRRERISCQDAIAALIRVGQSSVRRATGDCSRPGGMSSELQKQRRAAVKDAITGPNRFSPLASRIKDERHARRKLGQLSFGVRCSWHPRITIEKRTARRVNEPLTVNAGIEPAKIKDALGMIRVVWR